MDTEDRSSPALVKESRRQPALSQEDLARRLGISYATVNRREIGQSEPSILARAQLDAFCKKMTGQGKLTLPEGGRTVAWTQKEGEGMLSNTVMAVL